MGSLGLCASRPLLRYSERAVWAATVPAYQPKNALALRIPALALSMPKYHLDQWVAEPVLSMLPLRVSMSIQIIKKQLADKTPTRRIGFVSSGAPARQHIEIFSNEGERVSDLHHQKGPSRGFIFIQRTGPNTRCG